MFLRFKHIFMVFKYVKLKAVAHSNTTEDMENKRLTVSSFSEQYAKHWCTFLKSNTTFAQCHSEVDPEMYYKVQKIHSISLWLKEILMRV